MLSTVNGIAERLGASLRRGPYVWLALTLALFFLVLPGLSPLVEDQDTAKTWIAVVATIFIAYAVVAALILIPRLVLARSRQTKTENQIAAIRWSFGATPFLVGVAAVAANAKEWIIGVGFLASVIVLVVTARQISREARSH